MLIVGLVRREAKTVRAPRDTPPTRRTDPGLLADCVPHCMQVRRAYAANPEDRSMIGFLVGWFALLVTFVGLIQILSVMWTRVPECHTELGSDCDPETADWARWASTPHLLPLVLDVYLCVCAFIMCALELEINSRLLRDHMARPIEQSLAFLRVASGRGVFYCMTGLLAFDLR